MTSGVRFKIRLQKRPPTKKQIRTERFLLEAWAEVDLWRSLRTPYNTVPVPSPRQSG